MKRVMRLMQSRCWPSTRSPISPSCRLLRWALLLHDISKPETFAVREDGRPTFHGHEVLGVRRSETLLLRLRMPRGNIFSADTPTLLEGNRNIGPVGIRYTNTVDVSDSLDPAYSYVASVVDFDIFSFTTPELDPMSAEWKLWNMPHIAYRVDDLEEAMHGEQVIYGPFEPAEFGRVVFIHQHGVIVEFLQYTDTSTWFGEPTPWKPT